MYTIGSYDTSSYRRSVDSATRKEDENADEWDSYKIKVEVSSAKRRCVGRWCNDPGCDKSGLDKAQNEEWNRERGGKDDYDVCTAK